MEHFRLSELSPVGTIITADGEVVLSSVDKVSILTHDKRPTAQQRGLITITTHRLVWTDRNRKSSIALALSMLSSQAPAEVKPFSSKVLLRTDPPLRLEFCSGSSRERDHFVTELSKAVTRQEWVRQEEVRKKKEAKKEREEEYVPRRLGAAGVIDKVARKDMETGYSIATGFTSLNQLRRQAEELMDVAKKFRSAGGKLEGLNHDQENELLTMMAEMGIESPVTKDMAGGNVKTYREQLARQMAEFLRSRILNVGGIMTLTDAYCLVMRNRATTELVSPEDFRIACGYIYKLGLKIDVIRLESGVAALSVDASKDNSGAKALKEMADKMGSVTAIDVCRVRHVPIQRAKVMLEDAEGTGFLCRDETTEGVRFFPNMFIALAAPKQIAA